MSPPIRVSLEDVTLKLRVRGMRGNSSETMTTPAREVFVGGRIERALWGSHVVALQNINLTIRDGERVAILGHNGAGKTTLLRLLAGIYVPSSGVCNLTGERAALLNTNLGLSSEMTLTENVRVALALYGVPLKEINERIPEIIEFAELQAFADAPLKACSSGMKARLGFGIATSVEPDIFIVDEVFGAGDAQFIPRARRRLDRLFRGANTLVLSSHSLTVLREFCSTALWLEKGRVRQYGDLEEILKDYAAFCKERAAELTGAAPPNRTKSNIAV
ncbi:MAG: ATP-binding cassette domain-containing protein [Pseudomonadota bacterium]